MVGLHWYKAAMHVHTPKSNDYKGNKDITPKEFIQKANEAGVEILGITDHHSVEWIELLREAIRTLNLKTVLFPGVEIHISNGIHILVYFEPNTEIQTIKDFLSECGIHEQNYGDENFQSSKGLEGNQSIIPIIEKYHGFLVFAHVKQEEKGFFKKFSGTKIKKEMDLI